MPVEKKPVKFEITVRSHEGTHIMGFGGDEGAQRVLAYFKGWENLPEPVARRKAVKVVKVKKQEKAA